jgi:putative oxidoreductase
MAILKIWVPRVLLAIVFVVAGVAKFAPGSIYVGIFDQIGIGTWFRYFTGVLEIGGALLLLVPRAAGLGFVLLGCAMVGAVAFWLLSGSPAPAMVPGILLLLIVGFGWSEMGRWLRGLRGGVSV